GAVIEFPIHGNGWSVYWAWFHGRPLVNGYGTTEPGEYARLKDADHLSPAMVDHLRTFFHPRYVLLNPLLYHADHLHQVLSNISSNGDGLRLVSMAGGYRIYELKDESRKSPVFRAYPRWMIEGKRTVDAVASIGAARPGQRTFLSTWVNGAEVGRISMEGE